MMHNSVRFCVDQKHTARFKFNYNITVLLIIFDLKAKVISMCKEGKCDYRKDLKGCALKHIGEARKLIATDKFKEADLELSYAESHMKES
jgi:hypothetical protein